MSTNTDIAKLDDLIVTTIDSVKGYEHSADHAKTPRHETLFRELAQERRAVVSSLQERSRELGGTPNDFGSAAATLHRRFEDLRRVLGGGDAVMLKEIDRGEEYLKEEFGRVLSNSGVSPETRSIAAECYERVRNGHAQILQIKDQLEQAN